jgi:serine/threonine protein kinase
MRDNEGSVMGLLLKYVEHRGSLVPELYKGAPEAIHSRWADQIKDTVQNLHAMNITWGDVEPDNVLTDYKSDSWII